MSAQNICERYGTLQADGNTLMHYFKYMYFQSSCTQLISKFCFAVNKGAWWNHTMRMHVTCGSSAAIAMHAMPKMGW